MIINAILKLRREFPDITSHLLRAFPCIYDSKCLSHAPDGTRVVCWEPEIFWRKRGLHNSLRLQEAVSPLSFSLSY